MLKPSDQNSADPNINKALQYYATHTAQIEVKNFVERSLLISHRQIIDFVFRSYATIER